MATSFSFDARVAMDGGEATAALSRFGLLGFGETFEDAMRDLVEELRLYVADFFARTRFYSQSDRAEHGSWLLRFALTPPERQLELLYEDSREAAQPA